MVELIDISTGKTHSFTSEQAQKLLNSYGPGKKLHVWSPVESAKPTPKSKSKQDS